jgi:hypothetical protein
MEIGTKFEYKANDKTRTAIFLEDRGNKVLAVCIGDERTQGIKIEVEKKLICTT